MHTYTITVFDRCGNEVETTTHTFSEHVRRLIGRTFEQIRDAEARWYRKRFHGRRIVVT